MGRHKTPAVCSFKEITRRDVKEYIEQRHYYSVYGDNVTVNCINSVQEGLGQRPLPERY